jgi:hypothetical protein
MHQSQTIASVSDMKDAILTKIGYTVGDPRHEYEQPYEIRYDTGGAVPTRNTQQKEEPVSIRNFRPHQNAHNLNQYGFAIERMGVAMTGAVFHNTISIQEAYYPALEKVLWSHFPDATDVRVLEHNVSTPEQTI